MTTSLLFHRAEAYMAAINPAKASSFSNRLQSSSSASSSSYSLGGGEEEENDFMSDSAPSLNPNDYK